jgi:hypothetical protein
MITICRRTITVLFVILTIQSGFGAESMENWKTKDITDMENLARQLSFENYAKIRMLKSAIINYSGETVFENLINTYSDASAFYFSRDIKNAANLFARNEKEINEVASKLCDIYEKDTAAIMNSANNEIVKPKMLQQIKNKEAVDPNMKLVLNMASSAMQKAKDQNAWGRPIEAIYYYRLAKKVCFRFYQDMRIAVPEKYNKDRVDSRDEVFDGKQKLN